MTTQQVADRLLLVKRKVNQPKGVLDDDDLDRL